MLVAAKIMGFPGYQLDGVSYLVVCHYSLVSLFDVVFCILLHVANKLSLSFPNIVPNLENFPLITSIVTTCCQLSSTKGDAVNCSKLD